MRKHRYLTYTDRLIVEQMLNKRMSKQIIAEFIGVSVQTIYNEIKRGRYNHMRTDGWMEKRYSADIAQQHTDFNKTVKGAPLKLGKHYDYCDYVSQQILKNKKSPDVIVHELRAAGKWTVCTATLYSYIKAGYIPGVSMTNLWEPRTKKKKAKVRAKRPPAGRSIEHRPQCVQDRTEFGHWEMDLVCGKSAGERQALLVLTERLTRYEIIFRLPNKHSATIIAQLDRLEQQYDFPKVFRSITVDNGPEFADWKGMERSIDGVTQRTTVYYCHPYCSSEKGSCERANRIVRRFFPKGSSFFSVTQKQCDQVARYMNNLPRRVLGYATPKEFFRRHAKPRTKRARRIS